VKTTRCTDAERRGRLNKARQFREAAELINTVADEDELIDAYITLCVHAGIAAADVICCARLGVHAGGQSHGDAIQLLESVDRKLAKDLATLLGMKTRAGYSPVLSTQPTRKSAARSAGRLVDAAGAI
jgi:hypothetical protein